MNVVVTINSAQTSNLFVYSYQPPTITATSPTTGLSTAGGESLTIDGTNFGTAAPIVQVGGALCTSPVVSGHNRIVCTTPPAVRLRRSQL